MRKKLLYYYLGLVGEFIALGFLMVKGYIPIKRRYKTKYGEIDLICKKDGVLIFVEVKTRSGSSYDPYSLLSHNQQQRIVKASDVVYRDVKRKLNVHSMRVDIIFVNFAWRFKIKHFQNITWN